MFDRNAPLPEVIPVFPLTGALLLPHSQLPLNIFEPRYIDLIDDALRGHRLIGMVQPKEAGSESALSNKPEVYDVGCVGRLAMFQEYEDGRYFITLSGISRFKILDEVLTTTAYRQFKVDYEDYEAFDTAGAPPLEADRDKFMQLIRAYVDIQGYSVNWEMIEATDTPTLVNAGAALAPWEPSEKQALLEAKDMQQRYETLVALYEMAVASAAGPHGNLN